MAGEVNYTLSEAVYVAMQKELWWKQWFRRRILWFLLSLMVLGLAVVWLMEPPGPGEAVFSVLRYLIVVAPGMVGMIMLQFYLVLPYRARKLYRQTTLYGKPTTVSWSDEGVIETSTRGTIRFAWSDFWSWYDGRSAVVLFFNKRLAWMLPRAAFGAAELIDLRDTIARNVRRKG